MKRVPDLSVEVIVGSQLPEMVSQPLTPYSSEAISFLGALSIRLFANPSIRLYPDVAAFAYWCRRSNLTRLSRSFDTQTRRIGRGLVLHIAPANVPVNFAFSLAFGILAGNANIVRISESNHPQATIICGEISDLFRDPKHTRIAAMTRVIKYPREHEITAELSRLCHARVLWGGDVTINHLRSMITSPRCIDICFPDRYSLCILGAEAINAADEQAIDNLVSGFYNDVFLLDQNACSSPHLVIWQGSREDVDNAMSRFWPAMEHLLSTKFVPPAIHAVDKYSHLCSVAIRLKGCTSISRQQNYIYRVRLESLPEKIENYRGQHGFFFEAIDNDLEGLKSIVDDRFQTVTCFGVSPQSIIDSIIEAGVNGVDRVVPVGKALDIGVIWDGYDIIGTLSRIISEQ
ncbi:MAG: acyl-CoA reductase [Gammaproteobacteria bacterium]|nr:acyl-CoA reductase [Gammaproteobacteria bacterium]